MGDTGLELAPEARVGLNTPVLLGCGALRSAQVRSNCYQNCYQARTGRASIEGTTTPKCPRLKNAPVSLRAEALNPGIDAGLLEVLTTAHPLTGYSSRCRISTLHALRAPAIPQYR